MPSYEVTHTKSGHVRLVEARMPAQALAHAAKADYTVAAANAKRVGELFTSKKITEVEIAGGDDLGGTAA